MRWSFLLYATLFLTAQFAAHAQDDCVSEVNPSESQWVFSLEPFAEELLGSGMYVTSETAPVVGAGEVTGLFLHLESVEGVANEARIEVLGSDGGTFQGFACSSSPLAAGTLIPSGTQDSVASALEQLAERIALELGGDAVVMVDYPPDIYPNGGCVTFYCEGAEEPDDSDQDGIPDDTDNCPTTPNPAQIDADGDGIGDACDTCPNDPLDDLDGDGWCGNEDLCPDSDMSPTVFIHGADSGVPNQMIADGCTLADIISAEIYECSQTARNHGALVSCMTKSLTSYRRVGLLSGKETGALLRCVARSNTPK